MKRKPVFTVDGIVYDVVVPEGGLKRSGQVLDGENAGRVKSGAMKRDIIGTYYNYSLTLETDRLNVAAYDQLYEVLSAPVDSHAITMPYGQETITFEAYISGVDDELKLMGDWFNRWGGLTVTFTAMEPKRRK